MSSIVRVVKNRQHIWIEDAGDGLMIPRDMAGRILGAREWQRIAEGVRNYWNADSENRIQYVESAERPQNMPSPRADAKDHKLVYIIGSAQGPYKIGISKDPAARLKQLDISNPAPLSLVGAYAIPAAEETEQCIHNMFAEQRVSGEWFTLDKDDLAFVGDLLESMANET